MSSYYATDTLKPVCNLCKYTLGASFLIISTITDGVRARSEESIFGEKNSLDINYTGGPIPTNIRKLSDLTKLMGNNFEEHLPSKIKIYFD
jgi:hypothetical protein